MLKGVRAHLLSKAVPVCYVRQKTGRQREARIRSAPGLRSAPTHVSGATREGAWTVGNDSLEKCEDQLSELAVLGQGLIALNLSPLYQDVPLSRAVSMITTANGMGQMRLYKNTAGEPSGLLTWAWLSEWTKARLTTDGKMPLHQCEWNEGETLCFRDIAVTSDSALQISRDLAGELFPEESSCVLLVRDRSSKDTVLFSIPETERESLGTWVMSQFRLKGSGAASLPHDNMMSGARAK